MTPVEGSFFDSVTFCERITYNINGLKIYKNNASGIVVWTITATSLGTKVTMPMDSKFNVVLEKEKDDWKILYLNKM